MSGSTVTLLGPGGGAPLGERYARLHALAAAAAPPPLMPTLPQVQEDSWYHTRSASDREGNLQGNAYTVVQGQRQTVRGQDLYVSTGRTGATAAADFAAAAAGEARIGQYTSVAGTLMADGQAIGQAFTEHQVIRTPDLKLAQGRALAEAAARLRAAAAGAIQVDQVSLAGAVGLEAEGIARASASGFALKAPGLLQAQGELLAEAAARIRATAMGRVQAGDVVVSGQAYAEAEAIARAQASGAILASPSQLDARGQFVAEAVVRAATGADVQLEAKSGLQAGVGVAARTMVGAQTKGNGMLHLGVDRYGMPSFGLGAGVEATSGASAKTQARGYASILGLIRLGASGSVEGLAGMAGGLSGELSYNEGMITVGSGARAAAGIGGGAEATVSIGLGKLPMGVVQTVAGPVIAVPTLLINSIGKGIRALTGNTDPNDTSPGIEDLPQVAVASVKRGVELVGEGAKELGDQVVDVGKAIGSGAVAVGKAVVDGTVWVGKGIADGAVAVGTGVADGAVWVGKNVAKGATAVGQGIAGGASWVWKGITGIFD